METWHEIKLRHKQEKIDLVKSLAEKRYTQKSASILLGIELTTLNNFIRRNNIYWPTIMQGRKTPDAIKLLPRDGTEMVKKTG